MSEPQACRASFEKGGALGTRGHILKAKIGVSSSHQEYLAGDLLDNYACKVGDYKVMMGDKTKILKNQVAQRMTEITLYKEMYPIRRLREAREESRPLWQVASQTFKGSAPPAEAIEEARE
jgi:hypothetical protein